ncbi:hypothetical protein AVEN_102594-1 [Araneus ventricosus]|uniref:Uncharacterized protein n=1 Tax=Araneus ventricosus TaxID=182803 RepID=A0A4Y2BIF2_ARAVE|nr:hypothetical protein AVEN_102594-1 [Araneus ventricosus]
MRTSAGLSYSRIEITKDPRTKCLGRVHESRDEVLASHCNPKRAVYSDRNQSIGQYLSVHKDSFSNPPFNGRLEEVVVVDWHKMMKFKTS